MLNRTAEVTHLFYVIIYKHRNYKVRSCTCIKIFKDNIYKSNIELKYSVFECKM